MSSLVVFSVSVPRLAAFYEAVLGATQHLEPSGDIRLIGDRGKFPFLSSGKDRQDDRGANST